MKNEPDLLQKSFAAFLAKKKPSTARTYGAALDKFHAFKCEQKSIRRGRPSPTLHLSDLGVLDLDDFNTWLTGKVAPATQVNYCSDVTAFLKYLLTREKITFSVERARAILDENKSRFDYPISDPDPALLKIIKHYDRMPLPEPDTEKYKRARLRILRDRAIVYLLRGTAARLHELSQLTRAQVQEGRSDEVVIAGKGDKQRKLYIPPYVRVVLRAYLNERNDPYEPLFISHGKNYGHRLDDSMIRRVIYRGAAAVGIRAHPHDFRHRWASDEIDRGTPLEAIQEVLGHADISTTRRVYAHYSTPAIRALVDRAAEAQAKELIGE